MTIAPNETRFEVSPEPGRFYHTEYEYDAYELAVFSTGLAGDTAGSTYPSGTVDFERAIDTLFQSVVINV